MKTFGVIMAGGGGTRFWPLSRQKRPKQLLNLSGKDLMISETANRLKKVVPAENLYVVTAVAQADKIIKATAGTVDPKNVLSEPYARNTAACIGYAAIRIVAEHGDGVMIVSPSDAYIKDEKEYARVLKATATEATNGDALITIGIKPTFPATGYGYINFEKNEGEAKKVKKFVEKPDFLTAKKYVDDGGYLWNSGVFIWKASVILKEFEKNLPEIYASLMRIYPFVKTEKENRVVKKEYKKMQSVSVDYGIMEKAENVRVFAGDFGWNDVGSWDMLSAIAGEDQNGNVLKGDVIALDTVNSVVYSEKRLVATVGVNDLVVVETGDAVLVIPKDKAQDVKKIIDRLKTDGRKSLL